MGYPKPKRGETRRGSQRVESLSSGGSHEHYCCVPGATTSWAIILGTLLSEGVPDPIGGRLFILQGLGLPGTGYQVIKRPGISLGGEPGHPVRIWVL